MVTFWGVSRTLFLGGGGGLTVNRINQDSNRLGFVEGFLRCSVSIKFNLPSNYFQSLSSVMNNEH